MKAIIKCSDPALLTIGGITVAIEDEELPEVVRHFKITSESYDLLFLECLPSMFEVLELQYCDERSNKWEKVPTNVWFNRVLNHRKRIFIKHERK